MTDSLDGVRWVLPVSDRDVSVQELQRQVGNPPANSFPSSTSVTKKLHLMPIMVYFVAFGRRWQGRGDFWSRTMPTDRGVLRRDVCLWLLRTENGTHKLWIKVLYRALKMAFTNGDPESLSFSSPLYLSICNDTFFLVKEKQKTLSALLGIHKQNLWLLSYGGNFMITLTSAG